MSTLTKIALVTGGSRGLGKDMALSIARKEIDVILTYRSNKDEAEDVVKQIENGGRKAATLPLDMNSVEKLDEFVTGVNSLLQAKFNSHKLDFLINNAGMGATVPFTQVTEELFTEF
jgi:NAD(P)-dependent dehydrogenase (short-subunit alcohol dehydrogenase family)